MKIPKKLQWDLAAQMYGDYNAHLNFVHPSWDQLPILEREAWRVAVKNFFRQAAAKKGIEIPAHLTIPNISA